MNNATITAAVTVPFVWRQERRLMFIIFAVALALYAFTTPHFVTLEDDSLFIGSLHFWGVSHPPGYPAHTLFGGIFYRLIPFGSAAFKAHLFSGFAAACACVALYVVIRLLSVGRIVAACSALAFAASRDFWSQAIIAEVYTLNVFLFLVIVALCIGYANGNRRSIFIAAAVFGVGMANHYPLLCLASVGLIFLVAKPLRQRPLDIVACAAIVVAVAVPFYLWMVWRSHSDPVYNFYGPIKDFEGFEFYFLRRGYIDVDNQAGSNWEDKIAFLQNFGNSALWQFTPIGFFLVVVGFFAMARSRPHRKIWLALSIGFLTNIVVLIFLLNVNASILAYAIFRPYPLPAYGMMAVWLAFGAQAIITRLAVGGIFWRQALLVSLLVTVAGASLLVHWRENNRRDYRWTHDFALTKFSTLPTGAILFTQADLDFPLGYLHYVENIRPDLQLYNEQGLIYNNRLYGSQLPATASEEDPDAANKADVLYNFIHQRLRPIYVNFGELQNGRFANMSDNYDITGFFDHPRRDTAGIRYFFPDSMLQWALENLDNSVNLIDVWTRYHSRGTSIGIAIHAFNAREAGLVLSLEWQELIRHTRERYPLVRISMSDHLVRTGQMSEAEMRAEQAWLQAFDLEAAEFYDEEFDGRFYALRAALLLALGEEESPAYAQSLQRSLRKFVSEIDNPALEEGLLYYQKTGNDCAFLETINNFYPDDNDVPEKWRKQTDNAAANCDDSGWFSFS